LLSWWTKRAGEGKEADKAAGSRRVHGRFTVEPLESRLLLSSDPISPLIPDSLQVVEVSLLEFAKSDDLTPPSAVAADNSGPVVVDWIVEESSSVVAASSEIGSGTSTLLSSAPDSPSYDSLPSSLKEGDEVTTFSPRGPPELTDDLLKPIVDEALRRWSALTGDARLSSVEVRIADLPGNGLALHESQIIWIDPTAAGHGWFIDHTPEDDVEFSGAARVDGMDLLSVVMHELGHELGIDDHYGSSDDVMNGVLSSGTRRVPSPLDAYQGLWTDTAQPRFLVADITTVADSGTRSSLPAATSCRTPLSPST
jgi:hypothetical protein